MVGFFRESAAKEEDTAASQAKLKTPLNDFESFKFDFDSYSSHFDEFFLASSQPSLDFDAIKDWIEEMQDPTREEANEVDTNRGLGVESSLENPIENHPVESIQDMVDPEKSGPLKTEHDGLDVDVVVLVDNRNAMKSDGAIDCGTVSLVTAESGNVEPAEICSHSDNVDVKTSNGDEPCNEVLDDKNSGRIESLGYSIQQGLEKVSLVGNDGGLTVTESDSKEMKIASSSNMDDSENDSESESGSETSSSSSSGSSSSSESDDEEEDEEDEEEKPKGGSSKIKSENSEEKIEMEEGEIMGSNVDNMVSWSGDGDDDEDDEDEDDDVMVSEGFEDVDDDDGVVAKGPIKSKNELTVLPPVPPVNVSLQPCHKILPVGTVSSMLGARVVVEGAEKHNPLSEGSILWIADTRSPLGVVDEIFGPVKNPYYIVRYNSEGDIPSGIQNGTLVGFVPEFVDHVLNDKNIYQKGYDASGENDEELFDEVEFSDDEKEAEYKKMLKMSKRGGNSDQKPGNKKKNRGNLKNKERNWTKDQPSASASQQPTNMPSQTNRTQQQNVRAPQTNQIQQQNLRPPVPAPFQGNNPFQQQPQQPTGFPFSGMWENPNMPFQQQNSGFQNSIPWMQQNPPQAFQMPSVMQLQQLFPQLNQFPSQQPFDLSQLVMGSGGVPLGPLNSPWPGVLGSNLSNQTPVNMPGTGPQLPMFPGIQSNVQPAGQMGNFQQGAGFPANVGQNGNFQGAGFPANAEQNGNFQGAGFPANAGQSGNNQLGGGVPGNVGQNSNFQPGGGFPANTGGPAQFNQGFSPGGRGRGRRPFQQRGGGGRFGGGRGRQQ